MQKGYCFVRYQNFIIGCLYKTNVCVIDRELRTITLDTGGWWTRSTLKAINTTLEQAREPIRVRGRLDDCELIIEPYGENPPTLYTRVYLKQIYLVYPNGQQMRVLGADQARGFENWVMPLQKVAEANG